MKKVMLGVSLYPEQETLEEIDVYLKMASSYGFKKVFTSMFSVPVTKEEVIAYFKDFTKSFINMAWLFLEIVTVNSFID